MKLTPPSRACAMMRLASGASVGPPNIMVPRQISDTFIPLAPSTRYLIWPIVYSPTKEMIYGLGGMLQEEAIDPAGFARLQEAVAGGLGKGLEVGNRAGVGRKNLQLGAFRQLAQRLFCFKYG